MDPTFSDSEGDGGGQQVTRCASAWLQHERAFLNKNGMTWWNTDDHSERLEGRQAMALRTTALGATLASSTHSPGLTSRSLIKTVAGLEWKR